MSRIVAFLSLTALLLGVSGCGGSSSTSTPPGGDPPVEVPDPPAETPHPLAESLPIAERAYEIGVSGFIPANFPDPAVEDWQNLFALLPEYGELFGVHSPWDANPSNGVPEQVSLAYDQTAGSGQRPYVLIGFDNHLEGLSEEQRHSYISNHGAAMQEAVLAVVNQHSPDILFLGNEINIFLETTASGYQDFVAWYQETYGLVKEAQPDIQIGTVFQYEMLIGGAAISGVDREDRTDLIEDFAPNLDLIGLTLYPYFDYQEPVEIPDQYFHPIRERTSVPMVITETGWPSQPIPGQAIEASEQAQVDYLLRLLEILNGEAVGALIWVFPHDTGSDVDSGLFRTISLRNNDGTPKAAWNYWQALRSL